MLTKSKAFQAGPSQNAVAAKARVPGSIVMSGQCKPQSYYLHRSVENQALRLQQQKIVQDNLTSYSSPTTRRIQEQCRRAQEQRHLEREREHDRCMQVWRDIERNRR